ncbi:MAG TPA: MarR family transcriptional regulator [Vicinamibacterales bacterium]|nr:MarR family transcriptional regulator [Vicinamibacterales bacterium]
MSHPDAPTLDDYRGLAEFRYLIRRFLRFSEQTARSAGLEPRQHQMLLAIKGLPSSHHATIGALAERLQIQSHSAVELANRLVARGLVQRRPGRTDRRQVLLELTPEGENVLKGLSVTMRAELRSLGPTLVRSLNAILAEHRSAEPPDADAADRDAARTRP